jgi:hypothetical protein
MIRRLAALCGLLAIGLLVSPQSLCAATVNLNPISDAFVSSANPANNYGGGGAIAVSAAGLPKGELQSVLQFDLAGAKTSFDTTYGAGQWSVQSISLQLTASTPGNPIFNTSAAGQLAISWMQNDSWTEGTGTPAAPTTTGITWNSLPSFLSGSDQALGTFTFSGATSGAFVYTLSLGSGIVADTTGGQLASLRTLANDSTVSGVFNSRSFGTASARPILSVTAVPEPSAFFLAALAIGGMTVGRRFHNTRRD